MHTPRVIVSLAALAAISLNTASSLAQSGGFVAILDNGETGTSSAGSTWKVSLAPNPYGADSLYSSRDGATYTYRVNLPQPGEHEVYLWWTRASSRDPDVPVVVAHSAGTSTVHVNQTQNGGQWNLIGSWTFGATATITIKSQGNDLTACADAVGLVAVGGGANQAPQAFIDDIEPAAATQGEAIQFTGHGIDPDGAVAAHRWWSSLDGTLSSAASFASSTLSAGAHTILFSVRDDEGVWSSEVDALVQVSPPSGSAAEVILDNGEAGTSSAGGTWSISGASDPYGANSLYSSKTGATYTYLVRLPQAGEYELHLWWTKSSNRRTDVPVAIAHALGTSTVTVNQLQNPGRWNVLGRWSFGATATITIRSLGDGTTCADAVRLVRGGNQAPVAAILSILPNPATAGTAVSFNGRGTDADGSVAAYAWTSNLQGNLSSAASFTTTTLVAGAHIIGLRVRDNNGAWSAETRSALQVNAPQGSGAGDGFLAGVHVVPISPTLCEIRFDTSERMLATVRSVTSGAFAPVSDPEHRSYHSLYLRGLQPNASYSLRIELLSRGGATYTSSRYNFTTQDFQSYSVRSEHPRLLLRPEHLSELEDRIEGDLAIEWSQTRSGCSKLLLKSSAEIYEEGTHHYNFDAPALCLCYLLTGDQEYADKAIDVARYVVNLDLDARDLSTKGIPIVAPIYDSLFNSMPSSTRQSLGRDLYLMTKRVYDDQTLDIETVEGHTVEEQAVLLCGSLAVYNPSDAATVQLFRDVLKNFYYRFLPAKRFFMGVDGGSSSGWWYSAYSRDFPYLLALMALENASVAPLTLFAQESSWLSNYSHWYLYSIRGDHSFSRKNDTSPIYEFQHRNYLAMRVLAARTGDRQAQWLAEYLHETTRTGTYGSEVLRKAQYAYELLLHDKSVTAAAPSLPLAKWFRKPGVVIIRESWAPETVVATFVSAPYFTGGHQHLDDLSFSIYYKGGQAVDGGMYDMFGTAHHKNYYRRTLAHNAITVFDPAEDFCNPIGDGNFNCTGLAVLANDGGQKIQEVVPGFDYIPRHVDDLVHPQSPFVRGGVVIYEDTADYTYALGRGGPSYQSTKVAIADRHFLWLKSVRDLDHPLIVLFDNVEGRNREHVKTYHLHLRNTVSIAGSNITATNTNRITGEAGVLYDTVLLPRNPRIVVRSGDDIFEVDGVLFPPEERTDDATASILELERKRVDVSPPSQNLVDQFLNVLYATDAGGESRPASTLVTAEGMTGVAVKDWIVLFAPRELSREGTGYNAAAPASHLLIGMKDGLTFDVYLDGRLRATARSSSEGTLRFNLSAAGAVEVRRH